MYNSMRYFIVPFLIAIILILASCGGNPTPASNNPLPQVLSTSPSALTAQSATNTVIVNGIGFLPSSLVQWNGSVRVSNYISSTQLELILSTGDLAAAGRAHITVFNPSPGGGASSPFPLIIDDPVPAISSVSPSSLNLNDSSRVLTITGIGFVPSSLIVWNGEKRIPRYIGNTQLELPLRATDVKTAGANQFSVVNPKPGGGSSSSVSLIVQNPQPQVLSTSPSALTAQSASSTVIVNGVGFLPSSMVQWNGLVRPSNYISSTQMGLTLSAEDLATPGSANITVLNPSPGGGPSSAFPLIINYPAPTISTVSPSSLNLNDSNRVLTLTGSGFFPASLVVWNGLKRIPKYIGNTQLEVSLEETDVSTAGANQLSVVNPSPGGGASSSLTLLVENPQPTLESISPAVVMTNASTPLVTIQGTGFVPTSTVQVNGTARPTNYVNSSSITASLQPSDFTAAGALQIAVNNPSPGGGASSSLTLLVQNPQPTLESLSPAAVMKNALTTLVTVQGTGFIPASTVQVNGAARPTNYVNSSSITASLQPSDFTAAGALQIAVSNPTPGGGASSALTLLVQNPAPELQSIAPAAILLGSNTTVVLNGRGFDPSSEVTIGDQPVQSAYINSSQLSVTLTSGSLQSAGANLITIRNGAPGGGTSSQPLYVVATGTPSATGNPLVAKLSADLPPGASMLAEFGPDTNYGLKTSSQFVSDASAPTTLLVAGMHPSSTYHMRLHVMLPDGTELAAEDETFLTGAVPDTRIPAVTVTQTAGMTPSPGVELLDMVSGNQQQLRAVMLDLSGKLIWYYDYPLTDGTPHAIKLLPNGNMGIVLSTGQQAYREINLAGDTIRQITVPELNAKLAAAGSPIVASGIHHDFAELPNGMLGLLVNQIKNFTDLPGYPGTVSVLGDAIVVLDSSFNLVWSWSAFDHLDVNRHPWVPTGPPYDWTHSNALIYSKTDKALLVSMRHQSWILKLDFNDANGTGNIIWKLGPGGDFTLLGGSDPVDWFYNQHYPTFINNNGSVFDLGLFDNGDKRELDNSGTLCGATTIPCYSRPVVMTIDENFRTATLQWAPHTLFSSWGGEIQELTPNRVEYTFSSVPDTPGSRVVESTMDANPIQVWRMDIIGQLCYRAIRLSSLYPGVKW